MSEEVIVTGSQIRRGFDTPTPVTVIGTQDFARVAAPNIADALNQLPALKPSVTPQATTNLSKLAGGNFLDLRGLSYLRTLTLVDGRRYVPSTPEGVLNINIIPQAVVGTVEVVTGGASAVYGSDAVAGVVNFKLDHRLQGIRGSAQYGVSDYGDRKNYLFSVAAGTRFAQDRGHILIGAEHARNRGIPRVGSRGWGNSSVINNPAFTATNNEPSFILVDDARASNAAYGGVINSATGTGGTALLRGIEFIGGGQTRPFDYGTLTTATTQNGGTGVANTADLVLEQPYRRWAGYAGAQFVLAPAATAYASFAYSQSKMVGDSIIGNDQITIQRDNVFIPAAVRTILTANPGISSFVMGRTLNDYARGYFDQRAWTWQASGGVRGDLAPGWNYDVSYGYGRSRNNTIFADSRITAAWRLAVDAIDNPATPGVVDPICRSTLTNPTNGCLPLNLFGPIAPGEQAAAIASILGPSIRDWHQQQQVVDVVLRGTPFALPAGDVSFAIGGHWREFKTDVRADPLSASRPGGATVYRVGNTIPFRGRETVKEAYAEVLLPVLADSPFGERIEVDLAGRITDYRTSGQVETWKVGLNWRLNRIVRFRATRSRDIRAPNLQELFAAGQTLIFGINDAARSETYLVSTTQGGNSLLVPERANTVTAGLVLSPAPRLRASIDYYNIKIDGAIAALTAQQIVNGCATGDAAFCQLITRGPSSGGTPGQITGIRLAPANFQSIETQGVDFEASYAFPLGTGNVDLRALVTYVAQLDLVGFGGVRTELAGNFAQPLIDGVNGTSRIRAQFVGGFSNDLFRVNLTGRYVSGGRVTRDFIATKPTVPITDPIRSDGRFYLDLSGEINVFRTGDNGRIALFGSILNALNTDPPITGYDGYGAPRQLFDLIGRQYNVGLRFNF